MIDRRARLSACLSVVASLVLSACGGGGGGSSSPTSPSPAPTVAATRIIAISGSLAFGDVVVGSSREATITISNTGTAALSFTGITATGGLTTHSTASPKSGSIAPGGSQSVLFRFTPASAGSFSGTVTITSDHTSGTNTIAISGTGVGAPVTVTGVVTDSATNRAVGGVRVSALRNDTSAQSLATATTDGNGFYSMVVPSATAISMGYSRDGYNQQSATVTFTGDTRRDIRLVAFFSRSGTGNTVFDMPTSVSRVRIVGVLTGGLSNFIVRIGGRLVVNEIIGNRSGYSQRTDGVYLTSGGVVEITNSTGVEWTFTQEQ
jgi:hypothetical protein